jgi:hypothetical protein
MAQNATRCSKAICFRREDGFKMERQRPRCRNLLGHLIVGPALAPAFCDDGRLFAGGRAASGGPTRQMGRGG